MLDYARQRAIETLRTSRKAVLVTGGPAGVQASEVACQAVDLEFFLLLPQVSDHLFNLEHNPQVTLLAAGWCMKGEAWVIPAFDAPPGLELLHEPDARWCMLVHVIPRQLQIRREGGWGDQETIDLQKIAGSVD
jgi:hypothetical protein